MGSSHSIGQPERVSFETTTRPRIGVMEEAPKLQPVRRLIAKTTPACNKQRDGDHKCGEEDEVRWASLPFELWGQVFDKLEEVSGRSSWSERCDIVSFAGVCRSWRQICKPAISPHQLCDRLTFPESLKQPGPRHGVIRCYIKRFFLGNAFFLYLGDQTDNGKFLLSALNTEPFYSHCTNLVISLLANDWEMTDSSSSSYQGTLRSNIDRSKFSLYEENSLHHRPNFSLYTRDLVSWEEATDGHQTAKMVYEGAHGLPRRMHCTVYNFPAPSALIQPKGILGSPNLEFPQTEGAENSAPLIVMENNPPLWDPERKRWWLDFDGRVTVDSIKNFQLISSASVSETAAGKIDRDEIILQFGRVSKHVFTMDYRYPLSAYQAFAICLSALVAGRFF